MDKNRWPSIASANSGFTRTSGTFQAISLSKVMYLCFVHSILMTCYKHKLCTSYFDDDNKQMQWGPNFMKNVDPHGFTGVQIFLEHN